MTKDETVAKIDEHLDRVGEHLDRVGAEVANARACTARANEAIARVNSIREQIAALGTENKAALQALEAKFHQDARDALNEGGRAQHAAHEAMAAANFELGRVHILEMELHPEPPLQEQNRRARKIDGRLTPNERRAELEQQIASGEIPADKAEAFRRGLEIQMADEGRKAAKRRSILTRTLKALTA